LQHWRRADRRTKRWNDPEGLLQKVRHDSPRVPEWELEAKMTQTSIKILRSISPPPSTTSPRTRRRATR
jgi:hypothetical protein